MLTDRLIESLPSSGHLWALLNHLDATVVTDRFDISGMHSHRQFLFGVRGSSWTQNQVVLNGLTITHPSGEGMMLYPDLSALKMIAYSVGDLPSRHAGEREFHGQARLFFQGGAI